MKKKIIVGLVLAGLIGASLGYYLFNKPLESTESMKVDYKMLPSELLMAFESDETQANAKYLDKVIQVSGTVSKCETKDNKVTVYLDTDNPMSNIIFQLEKSTTEIKEGETITLKGICTGYLMDVVLVRAVLI